MQKKIKKGTTFEPLKVILENGLVNSERDTWKNSRRIVGNEFNNSHHCFSELMIKETKV